MLAGDRQAWQAFHRRYHLDLHRYAASRATGGEADDVVQLAYLRIARHLRIFDTESDFWRWLCCVVRCVAIDLSRKHRRRNLFLERFALWREERQKHGPTLRPDLNEALEEALQRLPDDDALLLRRKYCEGWSTEELAAQCLSTTKAVESRLGRLRARLKEILAHQND